MSSKPAKGKSKRETCATERSPATRSRPLEWSQTRLAATLGLVILATLFAYAPALRGPFVFDDRYLPFNDPNLQSRPVQDWLNSNRPLLMFTFWVNYRISELSPFSYHLLNVLLHLLTAVLVYRLVRHFVERVGTPQTNAQAIALFAAGVFALHPLHTEAVSYVASRSEALSVCLAYAALTLLALAPKKEVSWRRALAIVCLFGAAVATKEHTAALPAALLLTDVWWADSGRLRAILRNWRLYLLLAGAGAIGLAWVWKILSVSESAGFQVAGLPWNDYLYTQLQALWIYLRMFFLPYGQNIDHDYPIAHSFWNPATVAGAAGLVVLTIVGFLSRHRFKLAVYGLLLFGLLIAPTSSFVPIRDALVERRLYLPSLGLLLVVADLLRRWRTSLTRQGWTYGFILLGLCGLTYARNHVWTSEIALWEDSVRKNPRNPRAHFHLGYAHYLAGHCDQALGHFQQAAQLQAPDYRLLVDWALALDCAGRPEEAIARLRQALAMEPHGHGWALLGMLYGKQGRYAEALEALARAEAMAPRFAMTYVYRGNVYAAQGELLQAVEQYRRALAIDPELDVARRALQVVQSRLSRLAGAR